MKTNILEIHNLLKEGQISSQDLVKEALEKAKNNKLNAFVTICDDVKEEKVTDNLLSGIPCAIKDNLSTKGILTTGSSNTLKDYVPFFDATCVRKLKEAGAIIIGKTVLDELGMGGTGTTGHTGVVLNPWNHKRICGGSSSGSAASVASGIVSYALGSDTGDSVRKPAAFCSIVGYKPTYGMISRYGLYPFACSLDHVGVLSRNVYDAALVTNEIKGLDSLDMTTFDSSNIDLIKDLDKDVTGKSLCYIKEICDLNNYSNPTDDLKEILTKFNETIDKIKKLGIKVEEVSFNKDLLNAIYPTYLCISCAEATSNYSNLTGIIFGPRGEGKTINEIMKDHRTKGFSTLIKRRFIIGSYVLQKENQEKYFVNAQRTRRLIVDETNKLLNKYDGLILPCSGGIAPLIDKIDEVITPEGQILENHLAIANFGGMPSITIPNGIVSKMPIGINITGKIKDDANILNIAHQIEQALDFKDIAKEDE